MTNFLEILKFLRNIEISQERSALAHLQVTCIAELGYSDAILVTHDPQLP